MSTPSLSRKAESPCEHRVGKQCQLFGIRAYWCGLCQSSRGEKYRALWRDDRGPGKPPPSGAAARRLTPLERLEKSFRDHVMIRRLGKGMSFEQTLIYISARPWAAILKTLALCLECENFRDRRCTIYGESCQARTEWTGYILRRPCREKES